MAPDRAGDHLVQLLVGDDRVDLAVDQGGPVELAGFEHPGDRARRHPEAVGMGLLC
jgi:hypothetical protein